jgi:hypothetical protein
MLLFILSLMLSLNDEFGCLILRRISVIYGDWPNGLEEFLLSYFRIVFN